MFKKAFSIIPLEKKEEIIGKKEEELNYWKFEYVVKKDRILNRDYLEMTGRATFILDKRKKVDFSINMDLSLWIEIKMTLYGFKMNEIMEYHEIDEEKRKKLKRKTKKAIIEMISKFESSKEIEIEIKKAGDNYNFINAYKEEESNEIEIDDLDLLFSRNTQKKLIYLVEALVKIFNEQLKKAKLKEVIEK